jgi:hypothetical protein
MKLQSQNKVKESLRITLATVVITRINKDAYHHREKYFHIWRGSLGIEEKAHTKTGDVYIC